MKPLKLVLFFVVIAVAGVLSASDSFCGESFEIIGMKGDVKVMLKGKDRWISTRRGMSLKEGDKIKTGERSICDLSYGKNLVGVLENSEVIIAGSGNEKLKIIDAKVFAKIRNIPKGTSFEIRTPTAVCGARGTGIGVDGDEHGTTASAFENSIFVIGPSGNEYPVDEGMSRKIDENGNVSEPEDIPSEENTFFGSWEANADIEEDRPVGSDLESPEDGEEESTSAVIDQMGLDDDDLDTQMREEVLQPDEPQGSDSSDDRSGGGSEGGKFEH